MPDAVSLEGDFEDWIRGINRIATQFDGYRGYVALPRAEGSQDRHVAVRFESMEQLNANWGSDESPAWRAKLVGLVSKPSVIRPEVGIEHWCIAPNAVGPPSRHRMMVAVFFAILPLVTVIPPRLDPWLSGRMPSWLAGVITTAVLVVLMNYVAMPIVTRILRGWLQPSVGSATGGPRNP